VFDFRSINWRRGVSIVLFCVAGLICTVWVVSQHRVKRLFYEHAEWDLAHPRDVLAPPPNQLGSDTHLHWGKPIQECSSSGNCTKPLDSGVYRADDIAMIKEVNEKFLAMQGQVDIYKQFTQHLLDQQKELENKKYKALPISVSAFFGLASLYIIVSKKYDAEATKWACGTAGIIVGFWLGGA
jgi:hypothetical protein